MPFRPCPGSRAFAQPHPDVVRCPQCSKDVEIWSDEATGQCRACGRVVIRTETQSCVDWCRFAKDCLGEQKFREYGQMKATWRKAVLLEHLEAKLGADNPTLASSREVLRYAEAICSREEAADPNLVVAAALLLAIAPPAQPAATPAPAGPDVNPPALDAVRAVLHELDYPEAFASCVCKVLACVHSGLTADDAKSPMESRVILDALLLAQHEKSLGRSDALPAREVAAKCLTDPGRAVAMEMRRLTPPA
ncbi:MAG: hypothetical protein A3K19_25220 [Lentisphaerae bacterium RIFOXYB12_FULL_65_16]|nr:MAG: hypothetical protein A3K18_06655 [Lentisphaerae bacterium RIFOXYA12_64_32]OGV91123.1 MAG: hypothetical protein A3K19_25220 [Lentisphaerae bacterium RIFOXYB12_FULL_65_16]